MVSSLVAPGGAAGGSGKALAPRVCDTSAMRREFSAGGVLVRRLRGRWWLAAIRPGGRPQGLWALPKGLIGPDESPEDAALREVGEETGLEATPLQKLGDVKYVYTWAGERVFKIVSFFVLRTRGRRPPIPTPQGIPTPSPFLPSGAIIAESVGGAGQS